MKTVYSILLLALGKHRNYARLVCISLILLVCVVLPSRAQSDLSTFMKLYDEKRYAELLERLVEYRDRVPNARNPNTDLLLAATLCNMPQLSGQGIYWYKRVLSRYDLAAETRSLIRDAERSCGSGTTVALRTSVAIRSSGSGVGVRSKEFYWMDREDAPLLSETAKTITVLAEEEIGRRLFEPEEGDKGVRFIKELVGSGFTVLQRGNFIIASQRSFTTQQLRTIQSELQTVLSFYVRHYTMPEPRHLICVYIVPSVGDLRRLSERIHGLDISDNCIGYTFHDDNSIAATMSGPGTGTLRHELFHLLVRQNFGDIPVWFEEGIAALYEVSNIQDSLVQGLPNWRGKVLKHTARKRPTVEKLIAMDQLSFDEVESRSIEKRAANHAMARYFALYLQEKGKLAALYSALRNIDVLQMPQDDETKSIVERVLAADVGAIDADFLNWFGTLSH
ncbi:MAG: hypothetical protein M5R41_03440 [Bacteroidia bacterium]|nr:hypothetical protein [Bacteroidia bacterium]